MHSSLTPPRQVEIGDAARFSGTTAAEIRRYHEIGLLPEPERDGDGNGNRRYRYEDMIRLLWIRRMVDAGIGVEDIRGVFADAAPAGVDEGGRGAVVVQRLRTLEGRLGLLSNLVAGRLEGLPEGSLRQGDLDNLLVMERIFGPLGAAVNAGRYLTLAAHPGLREESDRVEAAEEALDDTIALDDPRVEQAAAERHAFELKLDAAIAGSGQAQSDDELIDSWDARNPAGAEGAGEADQSTGSGEKRVGLIEAIGLMPYDYSPARLRCMQLTAELAASDWPAS